VLNTNNLLYLPRFSTQFWLGWKCQIQVDVNFWCRKFCFCLLMSVCKKIIYTIHLQQLLLQLTLPDWSFGKHYQIDHSANITRLIIWQTLPDWSFGKHYQIDHLANIIRLIIRQTLPDWSFGKHYQINHSASFSFINVIILVIFL
jgi:hypothetical protein